MNFEVRHFLSFGRIPAPLLARSIWFVVRYASIQTICSRMGWRQFRHFSLEPGADSQQSIRNRSWWNRNIQRLAEWRNLFHSSHCVCLLDALCALTVPSLRPKYLQTTQSCDRWRTARTFHKIASLTDKCKMSMCCVKWLNVHLLQQWRRVFFYHSWPTQKKVSH